MKDHPIKVLLQPNSIQSPEELANLPEEYRNLLIRLVEVHTEGELTGADDYIKIFYDLAPNTYEKQICCERAIEELQHYELSAKVLEGLGKDASYMLNEDFLNRPLYPNYLVRSISSWIERGFFSYLGESVVLEHLLEFSESSYKPFSDIFINQIIKDEHVHVAHGYRVVREYCKDPEKLPEAQAALDKLWPHILDLFGKTDSARSPLYVKWGLRKTTNKELRENFLIKYTPKLEELGLKIPDNDLTKRAFV